ncbi:MAG TPA: hypothetical protein VE109_05155, partial [Acidobacteriaceae bacterium]|nr:hypothetical protein [Acidobacteriaceae bacterium]
RLRDCVGDCESRGVRGAGNRCAGFAGVVRSGLSNITADIGGGTADPLRQAQGRLSTAPVSLARDGYGRDDEMSEVRS